MNSGFIIFALTLLFLIVAGISTISKQNSNTRRIEYWKIYRLERKIDRILKHLGIEEEKTEFDVILEGFPASKKIAVLKVVRNQTSLGLQEAKDLLESAPVPIKEMQSLAEAEKIARQLEQVGAKVTIC